MNKSKSMTLGLSLTFLLLFACNFSDNKKPNATDQKGIFEAVFIDINDTIISEIINSNVKMERHLLRNLNLTNRSDFLGDKTKFYMHTLGSITVPESKYYFFKLVSSGGILFKINNIDVFNNKRIHSKEIDTAKVYLDKGYAVFEAEYFSGVEEPYLVLEWSKDGKNYEKVPDNVFHNLDALNVKDWIGYDEDSSPELDNILTDVEKKEGWKLLFDGMTTKGWHTYNRPGTIGSKWKVEDGMLVFKGRKRFEFYVSGRKIELGPVNKKLDGGEDIVSDDNYENFELNLEWKISEAGNNGIFYTVKEDEKYDENWKTSPEMQVMDNQKHKDGVIYKHRTGDLYDLIASSTNRVKPQGKWNKVRIIKDHGKVEHWLNGTKVVSYDMNSDEWKDLISKSKFANLHDFASPGPGKIGFQDHDNLVYYKNIKIKLLK